jgi:hypothetical protein
MHKRQQFDYWFAPHALTETTQERRPLMLHLRSVTMTIALMAVVAGGLLGPGSPHLAAQNATPVATPVASPVAGGVPCTALFGIVAGNACVLTLNGSADTGPLDVYVDGVFLVAGESFGTLGDFVPVAAGEHFIQFVPSGAPPESAVLGVRVDLRDGVAYELAALGAGGNLRGVLLPVDTRPLRQEGARLRMVHGSPDAPALDLAITGGVPVVADLRPGAVSPAIDLPSGTYALEVREAGTQTVLLPLPGTVLNPNTTYTFFAIGTLAGGTFGVILVPVAIPPEAAASATPIS